ncbi:sodium-dependent organic anion transporter-like [Palaemon carinicauda]|uniref:sodium-dependent organic anion transporter-like n=1 Tax=Palaemon carinicauda TaxID=392227 RepID=UPI0035B5C725
MAVFITRACVTLSTLLLWVSYPTQGLYMETYPNGVWKIPEDTLVNLTVSVRLNSSDEIQQDNVLQDASSIKLSLRMAADEDWKLDIVNPDVEFTAAEVESGANKSITLSGYYWGLSKITFYVTGNEFELPLKNGTVLHDDLQIVVDRKLLMLDHVFIGFGLIFMLINNTMMGSQLDLHLIFSVLRKPLGPLCGFISQFTLMPLLTFFFGKLFFDNPLDRLGLFTLGCCPGGLMSNFWTLMFDGDINLSITMTAVSTIAAMGMMPLWMFTLGKSLLEDNDNLQIPFMNLVFSLIGLTIPVGLGILLKHKRPQWATKAQKIIKPFTLIVILFFMIIGTYNSYKVFLLMTGPMVAAGFLVSLGGYTLGALFAKLFCLAKDKVIAISIETAMQNPGVAFMLLKLSLPSPNSDLAALPIMAAMMLTGPPVMILYAICALSRRFCGCCLTGKEEESTDTENCSKETNAFLPVVEAGEKVHKNGELPAKTLENGELPAKILQNGELPVKTLENGELPAKILQNGELPSKTLENGSITEKSENDELYQLGKTSNTIVLEGFTKSSLRKKMSV